MKWASFHETLDAYQEVISGAMHINNCVSPPQKAVIIIVIKVSILVINFS